MSKLFYLDDIAFLEFLDSFTTTNTDSSPSIGFGKTENGVVFLRGDLTSGSSSQFAQPRIVILGDNISVDSSGRIVGTIESMGFVSPSYPLDRGVIAVAEGLSLNGAQFDSILNDILEGSGSAFGSLLNLLRTEFPIQAPTTVELTGVALQTDYFGGYEIVDGGRTVQVTQDGFTIRVDSLPGWSAIHTGYSGEGGYSLLLYNPSIGFVVWNLDSRGEIVSVEDTSNMLDYEVRFGVDINGDGQFGHVETQIEDLGEVGLQATTRGYYQITDGGRDIPVTAQGQFIAPGSLPGWTALHAGRNDLGGYSLLWYNPTVGFVVWNLSSGGAVLSQADTSNMVDFEARFGVEINGDGRIGHFTTVLEDIGVGLQSSTHGYYQVVDGASEIIVTYLGQAFAPGSLPGWSALHAGADEAGGYNMLWYNPSFGYAVWTLDENGAVVGTGDTSNMVDFEDSFGIDFNGDGVVGHTATDIDAAGVGLQSSTEGHYQIVDGETVVVVTFQGAAIAPGSLPGWTPLQAGSNGEGGYNMLWQHDTLGFVVWVLDGSGAIIETGDTSNMVDFEDSFDFDFNGDGVVGHTVTDIDTAGVGLQSSTEGHYQIVDGDEAIIVNVQGAPIGPDSIPGWAAVQAGSDGADGYSLLWFNETVGYVAWDLDGTGMPLSTSADPADLVSYEDRFEFDINGDGQIGQIGLL